MPGIKDAIHLWEKESGKKAADETKVQLLGPHGPANGPFWFIEKMDATLKNLVNVEHLSLGTNMIEKIENVGSLKTIKILSLGRNQIKALTGLEGLSNCLEQLWISYNNIDKMKNIGNLRKLKVLYMANNKVSEISEFLRVGDCPEINEVNFVGNPIQEMMMEAETWRSTVSKKIKSIKKLDGEPLLGDDDEDEEEEEEEDD